MTPPPLIPVLAVALCATANAGLLDDVCDAADERGETVTESEYWSDPTRHSEDFCALAKFEPIKAARQLGKLVGVVRRFNNSNRYYFDPRRGSPPGLHIQLLRPWMQEENSSSAANWRVSKRGGVEDGFLILDARDECRGEGAATGCKEIIVSFDEGELLWFENGRTELGYQRLRIVYNDSSFFVPPPQGRAFKAAEVRECVEWYLDELRTGGENVIFPDNCPHLSDEVSGYQDSTFDITLRALEYAPTGGSPNEKIQRAMEAAKERWEEIILKGFPDQANVRVRALYIDRTYHTNAFTIDNVDDLFIGYYVDPHADRAAVSYSFNTSHDMPSGARRVNVGLIRWPASMIEGTRYDWLVKIAMHEIGHAILFNFPSRDHNGYGDLWNRVNDTWTGSGAVRAYREVGGESMEVPMEDGVHWPYNFIESTSSGGDIMETRINEYAALGSITLSALRDYGYSVKSRAPAYQPLTFAAKDSGNYAVFECGNRGAHAH